MKPLIDAAAGLLEASCLVARRMHADLSSFQDDVIKLMIDHGWADELDYVRLRQVVEKNDWRKTDKN